MILQQLVNGLSLGSVYAVFAVGFTLVFGVLNVLNLSQGAVFMWGAYLGLEVVGTLALPLPAAVAVAFVAAGLLGVLSEWIVFRPLQRRGAHRWMGMVASLALARILIGLAQEAFGTQVVRYPDSAMTMASLDILGARVQLLQLVALAAALTMVLALGALLRLTNLGRAIRTVAFSETVARLVGAPVDRVRLATFFVAGALAGGAGVLWSLVFQSVSPFMGDAILLKGLTVLILGGLGNVLGALAGGLLLGLVEVSSVVAVGSGYRDAIGFGLVLAILLVRPTGLFATREAKRA
ncbi:High-affinity branched-chain amino acid transport system permease protein LivH [Methylobacterium crusticola]|uniref:High-affinity branched-chain amino acid transport system permease protein LivH n=1 Tax=Methylobacterium crusticola TaxID=1697972 RepID=A0ABQ4QTM1_9HYPH|nr:branched-chain amino acid ABC transporter permease [Methylobacterium crusticola]GJD48675.1 High-affinity branched-chain amino acid transport system permease protein LivH [Methylobacterium crusticola]